MPEISMDERRGRWKAPARHIRIIRSPRSGRWWMRRHGTPEDKVRKDPNYEPASVLLERIRAEKAHETGCRKARKGGQSLKEMT
jgi:hypothetical protein